jgi:hypothetical protein
MLSHTLSTKTSLADILVHRLKFLTIFFIFCQLSTLLQLNQFELSASDWNLPGAVLCPTPSVGGVDVFNCSWLGEIADRLELS